MALAQRAAPEAREGCVSDRAGAYRMFLAWPNVESFVIQVLLI